MIDAEEPTGVLINAEKIREITPIIGGLKFKIEKFEDTNYYPSKRESKEDTIRYFLVLVSMDHRLSRPGRPFEAEINGRIYHGADLLYKLGMMKYLEDPEFYSPTRLSKITLDDVEKWLSVGNIKPVDLELRTLLLRDIGYKLEKLYEGEAIKLVERSCGKLRGGWGLIDRLKIFTAYQDPVEKKSFLLVKFLDRRGLFKPLDVENLEVPVDNHLTRIALRLGIVEVKGALYEKLKRREEYNNFEDQLLRLAVREAYKILCLNTGKNPLILDDFLWSFGRRYCKSGMPECYKNKHCIFIEVCKSVEGGELLDEPNFYKTWYY